jgi:hypothetical protein
MSKLALAITPVATGNYRPGRTPIRYVATSVNASDHLFELRKEYRVGVLFEKCVWVSTKRGRNAIEERASVTDALCDVKRAMVEEVFGEFRPMLIEMRCALHDEDLTRMRDLLATIEHQMFVEGI